MFKLKTSHPNFPRVARKESSFYLRNYIFQNSFKNRITFGLLLRQFVAKKFKISPNLVTLQFFERHSRVTFSDGDVVTLRQRTHYYVAAIERSYFYCFLIVTVRISSNVLFSSWVCSKVKKLHSHRSQ